MWVDRVVEGMKSLGGGRGAKDEKEYEELIRAEAPQDAGDVYEMVRIVSERLAREPYTEVEAQGRRYPMGWRPNDLRELSEAFKSGWQPEEVSGEDVSGRTDEAIFEETLLVILSWQLVRILGKALGETVVPPPAGQPGEREGFEAVIFRKDSELLKLFPAFRYQAVIDNNTCGTCVFLDGKILPASHLIWKVIFPKLHIKCRCKVAPVPATSGFEIDDPELLLAKLRRLDIDSIKTTFIPYRLSKLRLQP